SLLEYIDPFESGEANSTERQAMMIAQRIRALHQGTETRILGADGNWNIVPAQDPVDFGEIMILMASRGKLRDAIIKHLQEHNIPTQADKEGSLLERPAAAELDGLVQFVARPESRFAAAWVARSSLIGMTDSTLQDFLNSEGSNNLMERLLEFTVSDEQKALVQRWISLSSAGRLLDILDETIDQSDLLTAYHDSVSAQDVEKFVDEVRRISNEVGGDPMVIADRIRSLREQKGRSLQAQTIPASDAVRVMSIHGSKGLQAKVVIVADLFSGKQVTMTIENQDRLIVSPEFFAGHPSPWSGQDPPLSAMWRHTRRIHQARKNAEARRLLYVAATRVKQHLIIVGSPKKTEWKDDSGLVVPWGYSESETQLGQMWAESLRQGSWRRVEATSPWLAGDEDLNGPPPISKKG
ncbi:MAG TPA: 3'-5' exonuclease, partial [Candidatus Thalassarchaeaceae archaeon]|nr:3'-5' exonuclease [Candidatus Thalassarchaeaceae archaeon]